MSSPRKHLPTTRSQARAVLERDGVTGAAAETLLRATAPDRHAVRVDRYLVAALDEWCRMSRRAAEPPYSSEELQDDLQQAIPYAIAVLVIEEFGVVDPTGPNPHNRKIHHRAFRDTCGPRVGVMSGATHAACRGALDELWRRGVGADHGDRRGPAKVLLRPAEGEIAGLVVEAPPLAPAVLTVDPTEDCDAQAPAWLSTVAIEALRRGYGAPWFQLGAERQPEPHERNPCSHLFDLVQFEGDAAAWGRLLNAIEERTRVEHVSARLARGVKAFVAAPSYADLPLQIPAYAPAGRRPLLSDVTSWIEEALPGPLGAGALAAARAGTPDEFDACMTSAFNALVACAMLAAAAGRAHAALMYGVVHDATSMLGLLVLELLTLAASNPEGEHAAVVTTIARDLQRREGRRLALTPEPDIALFIGDELAAHLIATAVDFDAMRRCVDLAQLIADRVSAGQRDLAGVLCIGTPEEWRDQVSTLRLQRAVGMPEDWQKLAVTARAASSARQGG